MFSTPPSCFRLCCVEQPVWKRPCYGHLEVFGRHSRIKCRSLSVHAPAKAGAGAVLCGPNVENKVENI
jgi:hypothetical protein